MRLYLAVAVLMLAFIAYTEAQEDPTIEERFSAFSEQMSALGKTLADKTKTTFEQIHTSDFAVKSKNWLQEQLEKVKAKFGEISQ